MQFYAQSCGLYFKRGAGKFKPVQMSMKRIVCQYLDSTTMGFKNLFTIGKIRMIIAPKPWSLRSQGQESSFWRLLNLLEL
jgi:hypothetical protein